MHRLTIRLRTPLVALGLLLSGLFVSPGSERLAAQGAGEDDPGLTLAVWAQDVWLTVLDRDGSFHGRFAEEGIFQRFHPRMDDEYPLDLRTGLFTAAEDARWVRGGNGLRAAGASVSHPHIVNVVDWRQAIPVTENVDVLARFHRERSFTARRDYPRVGVRWKDAFGSDWTAGAHLGLHFFKPSADVELTLARRWGGPAADRAEAGRSEADRASWELEVGIAALDAFSDLVFQSLGVQEGEVEAHVDQRTVPWAARGMLRRASRGWRAEIHAGGTARTHVRVTYPAGGREPFSQEERVGFAGALVDVDVTSTAAVALWATVARADTERRSAGPGFALREETVRAGLRQRTRLAPDVRLVAEIERVWRPEERTERPASGPDRRIDHRDRATFGRLALERRPAAGWTGRLAWALLDRRAGVVAPDLTGTNHRLVTAWGWRFPTGVEIAAGLRWDLDALGRSSFDGGQVGLSARW